MNLHYFQMRLFAMALYLLFPAWAFGQGQSILELLGAAEMWASKNHKDSAWYYAELAYRQLPNEQESVRAMIYYHYAKAAMLNQKYDSVEFFLDQAVATQEKLGAKKRLADTYELYSRYYLRGNNFEQRLNSPKAYEKSKKAFDLYQEVGDQKGLATAKLGYAVLLNRMGEFYKARDTYQEALHTFESIPDSLGMYNANLKLGQIYGYTDRPFYNLDTSINYCKKAILLAEQLDLQEKLAYAHNFAASPLIRKGYEDPTFLSIGLASAQFAKHYYQSDPRSFSFKLAYLNEGFAYEALGQHQKALTIAKDMLERFKSDVWTESEIHRLLYRITKKDKQYQEALKYYEWYRAGFDSIESTNLRRKLSRAENSFLQIAKDREIESLAQKAQIQSLQIERRNWQLGGLGFIFLLVGIGGFFYYQSYKSRREKAEAELKQRFLRSQLNPHFIFNAIGAIQEYNIRYGAEQGSEYLGVFSHLMRQILEFSREEFISIDDEVDTLTNYLQVQQMLYQDEFTYEINVSPDLETDMEGVPPMFAQPVIENALEHGLFRQKNHKSHISIQFDKQDEERVCLTISDNGTGFQEVSEKSKGKQQSLSRVITKERLEILAKQTKQKATYHANNLFNDEGEVIGAKVTFELPLKPV